MYKEKEHYIFHLDVNSSYPLTLFEHKFSGNKTASIFCYYCLTRSDSFIVT